MKPPSGEWMCPSCRFYDKDDDEQWKKHPCNKCSSKEGIRWQPIGNKQSKSNTE